MNMTKEEHHRILKDGSKGEQRVALNEMVDDYLRNNGGVIQRISMDRKSSTYWEMDAETNKLKKIL